MSEYITSRKNAFIQQVRRLLSSRKERETAGLYAADGTKLLQEAVRYAQLDTVILSEGVEVQVPEDVRLVTVSPEIMEYISPMETPQGALFLCKMPEQKPFSPVKGMLLLDGIQDPGNLGTILRTADALDVPVVLLEGCADPYNHKTVRASMGAVFRRDIVRTTWAEAKEACEKMGISVGVTALSEKSKDIREYNLKEYAVVIGSEGRGVRQEILNSADAQMIIPMNPHCESLNAAAASTIVLWQMTKR